MSVQNIADCIGHIIGGQNKDDNCFAETLFDPMNYLDPEKKLVDLHIFDGASVCRKDKNIESFLSYALMYCWSRAYLPEYFKRVVIY